MCFFFDEVKALEKSRLWNVFPSDNNGNEFKRFRIVSHFTLRCVKCHSSEMFINKIGEIKIKISSLPLYVRPQIQIRQNKREKKDKKKVRSIHTRFVSWVSIMKLCTCFSARLSSNLRDTTATSSAVQPAPYTAKSINWTNIVKLISDWHTYLFDVFELHGAMKYTHTRLFYYMRGEVLF